MNGDGKVSDVAGHQYVLASSDAERERLARQAQFLRPITERLFRSAGLQSGMRVLDVGCGAGDVSALAAELVGPNGEVIGCDRDPAQVDAASKRWADIGHLRFAVGTFDAPPAGPLDAVVGRAVLMHQPDMAESLRAVTRDLVPGGVVAFVELSVDGPSPMWPPPGPLAARLGELVEAARAAAGVQPLAGLRLPSVMRAAGLEPQPPYESGSMVYEGREAAEMQAALVMSMLPLLENQGHDVAEFNRPDLVDRLHAEQETPRVIAVGPLLGVWAQRR